MKRSLSFTDLKGLSPSLEIKSRNVRKIQSCTGRFEDPNLSPSFFDELLEEYENEEDLSQPACAMMGANGEEIDPSRGTSGDQPKPFFTTQDLTELLAFLQPKNLSPVLAITTSNRPQSYPLEAHIPTCDGRHDPWLPLIACDSI
jgi:hypothetical protein